MQTQVLMLLLMVGGSMAFFLRECNIHHCSELIPGEQQEEFSRAPPNAEQLKRMCPNFLKAKDCFYEGIVDCTGSTFEELLAMNNETVTTAVNLAVAVGNILDDICDENSELHKGYASNAECFKDFIMNADGSCRNEGYDLYDAFRKISDEEEQDEEGENERHCLSKGYTLACYSIRLGKTCGDEARQVFNKILKRVNFLKIGVCSEEDFLTLKTKFVDFLETEGKDRNLVFSAFDYRRK